MLVAIINKKSEVLFIDSVFSQAVKNLCGFRQIVGRSIFPHIKETKDAWVTAVANCFANRVSQTCEIILGVGENRSRWRVQIFPLNANQAVVLGVSLPLNIAALSTREIEVMRQVSLDRSTEQIAESLEISISTVEKHRHRIRNTLSISRAVQLLIVAKSMFHVDSFFCLSTKNDQ